ncbi:MAG: non-ribosomal peptide synthetase [Methanobrevibacter sp.]|jgi:amino acid adenylation domain-containing protein|nr:non-ribosomal peptide synthetase [Candidatus Methanovirga australis]
MFFKDLDENLKKFIYGEKVNIDKTVIQSFQEQVKKTPKKIAIVDSDLKFTYEELDIISSIFSNYLLDLGLKKGSKVAILVGRTIYMPISFISLLKIGIIYVPIDSLSPNERVKHVIKDSESIIVTDDSVYKIESIQITQINTSIINEIIDKVRDGRASISDESIRKNSPSLDDEFIVLYTSGTTGNPKGAILTHRNIANLARYYADHYSINNCSNIGAFASFGFDFSLADFYPALISGATVYIVPNEFRTNIMNLNNFYNVNNITHSGITTQLGRQFIISCDNNSLKHLLLGGEKLMPITPPKNYTVHNIYGPTECTVSVTDFVLDELHETRVPIGTPVYNTGIYIMNNKNELVKPGELGEICIEGDQVFKGYINKSETKKSLCKNPYTQKKMYRTGDIGTYLADGNIDILGRKDTQVKVRGFRIELSEVEKAIIEYENVLNVTTIALSASNGEKMIVAYVVPKDKNSFIVSELNEFLQDCLIKYMIPQFIMVLNSLPVNQNGKVDKKNLPKPNLNTYLTSIPPKNKTEKDFIELFKNVLHEDDANIGAEDSFFDIGGSSLTATILLVEASKIGYEISYKDIFENPTPAKLALFVSKKDEYFDEEHSVMTI